MEIKIFNDEDGDVKKEIEKLYTQNSEKQIALSLIWSTGEIYNNKEFDRSQYGKFLRADFHKNQYRMNFGASMKQNIPYYD